MEFKSEKRYGPDLFQYQGEQIIQQNAPLADRLRPTTLDEFVGQGPILAEGRLLRRAIKFDRVGNVILHGPPGVGKTTLAKIIALNTCSHFTILNAVLAGVKDLRDEVVSARERLEKHGLKTILFIDEVHRFNTAQQDALLPWVENGTLTLIGATTENPYFEVNKALLSRSRIFRLKSLEPVDLKELLNRALQDKKLGYGNKDIEITEEASKHLIETANGDARSLLNALELAVESTPPNENQVIQISLEIAEESIQERAVLYDKHGDFHFDTISAFIKSLRGSDPDAALFWLARMIEAGENPRFIFRRMLISASEDIGLADPQAIVVVEACAAAFERVGLPEGLYALSQAAVYLASTDKSNSLLGFFEAQAVVRSSEKQDIPSHLRDPHRDNKAFGDGVGYRYPHAFNEHWIAQQYLPKALQGQVFWKPTDQGWEGSRREKTLQRRAIQLAASFEAQEENPLLLTFTPTNSKLEMWKQRNTLKIEDRLKFLQDKLWDGISWNRNERVLVITGGSLSWAIEPLLNAPEGGVTILSQESENLEKIAAQIDFLDPLNRPNCFNNINSLLKDLPSDLYFEWIGGRINSSKLSSQTDKPLWQLVKSRCNLNTGLRLLNSSPMLGPARAISQIICDMDNSQEKKYILDDLIKKERKWLDSHFKLEGLKKQLHNSGWDFECETWEESFSLNIDEQLKNRWLGENSFYRKVMHLESADESLKFLKNNLDQLQGKVLPQKLIHTKFIGKLKSK